MTAAIKRAFGTEDIPKASTHIDASLSMAVTHGMVPGDDNEPDPLLRFDFTDILDDEFNRALRQAPVLKTVRYIGSEPITTVAYAAYGNTTAWMAVLTFNGYMHQCDIPSGSDLRLPDLSFVLTKIKSKASQKETILYF